MFHPAAITPALRLCAYRPTRHLLVSVLAAGWVVCNVQAAEPLAPAATPALRMVQSKGTMMWVLDGPAQATAASAPGTTPALDTQLIEGRYVRVLRTPGPATASPGGVITSSSDAVSRVVTSERVLPNGARMLALPADAMSSAPTQRPALVERVIDPTQSGTQAGDVPAANTLYRATPR